MPEIPKCKEHSSIYQRVIDAHLGLASEMAELPDNFYSVGVDMESLNPGELFELRILEKAGLVDIDNKKRAYWLTQEGTEVTRKMYEEQTTRVA